MIRIAVRSAEALRSIDHVKGQLPFATSKALNDVALEFQKRERAHLSVFTLRRRAWAERNIKITHFATKTELFAQSAIEAPGDPSRSDILSKFEDQTQKRPRDGGSIALPVEAKRSKADIVRKTERPKAFNFREVGARTLGDRRTFILPIRSRPGARGIFQRVGKGRASRIRLLFFLKAGAVPIDPVLDFYENATETINQTWSEKFDARLRDALATAR